MASLLGDSFRACALIVEWPLRRGRDENCGRRGFPSWPMNTG